MADGHKPAIRGSGWGLAKFRSTRQIYAETGLASSTWELDRLAAENVAYTLGYYRRLVSLVEPHYRGRLLRTIRPVSAEHLIGAHRQGRGLILVAPHLGDFELAVAWIAAIIGRAPVVPVASLGRPFAQRVYASARRACSFDLLDSREASLAGLSAKLKAGRVVILTLDRRAGARTLSAQLFNRPTQLPAACLSLARRAGAPLLSAATWNNRGERILAFGEPLGPGTASARDHDGVLMQHLATDVEVAIRVAPQQWHIPARLEQLSITLRPPATLHSESRQRAVGSRPQAPRVRGQGDVPTGIAA
jgi:KDO2-lipid IV(A) lauroyltransferase